MDSRIVDGLIALCGLIALAASLITIMVFVPSPDLVIVLALGISMAAYDFYKTFFRGRKDR